MNRPEGKNPEHRSTAAILCFCIGAGLCILAYVLGIGAVLGAALSGSDPIIVAGSFFAAISLALSAIVGFVLMVIGGVWMLAQVIADQSGGAEEKRYRDVER